MEKRLKPEITEIATLLRQGECSVREGVDGIEEAFEDWKKRKKYNKTAAATRRMQEQMFK